MADLNISLPDRLKSWAEQRVADGDYSSTSDYVRDLMRRDREAQVRTEWLRAEVEAGFASTEVDGEPEDVIGEMVAELEAARA